jgi:hypothetical protein
MDVFARELEHTGLINIGRAAQARDPFFSRVLHLVKAPPGFKPPGEKAVVPGVASGNSTEPAGKR